MQLGWVPGGGQVGEVVAKRLGFYEREGIDLKIEPGGPNIDGVAIVASGVGEPDRSRPAHRSCWRCPRDCRSRCFAVGVQRHPYAFFSLGKNPIRKPQDMIGKRIGIHATGMVLLKAMLARHQIPRARSASCRSART